MVYTEQLGNITELESILAFIKLGYSVSIPYGNKERYDFIVDIDNKLYKIQSKKCKLEHHKLYDSLVFKTSTYSPAERLQRKYTKEEVDYFVTTYEGVCYLVPFDKCPDTKKILYLKDYAGHTTDLADDYELSHMIINKKITH